jgi:MFS family permease
MLIQAIPFGVASNIQPQFVSYVVSEKNFTLAGFSLIFTLGTVASAVASPFIGVLFNKVNTKMLFLLGAILSGGGFFAFSICNHLWQFYLVAAVVQVGTSVISSIGVPLVINRWFDEESKGKAMGIAFAGSGLGNIFLQQLSVNWIAKYGYAVAYQKFALVSVVVGLVVSLLLVRTAKDSSEMVVGKAKEAEAKEEKVQLIKEYASNFGILFQVYDDIIDCTLTTDEIGKTAGKDANVNKLTYVSAYGLNGAKNIFYSLVEKNHAILTKLGIQMDIFNEIYEMLDKRISKSGRI